MKELDKKQKIIAITIIAIIAGAILYYVYGKDEKIYQNEILPYEETETEENNTEKEKNIETEEETEIIIYITGEVNKPGVYALPEGSRIVDAIEQAEDLTEEAYTEEINLAYVLEDGMKIVIPSKSKIQNKIETQEIQETEEKNSYITTESGITIEETEKTQNKTENNQKVNINTATQEELETLTGIGPSTASKIIQYRKEKGNFKSIEEIKNVSGVGDSKFENIKENITVSSK